MLSYSHDTCVFACVIVPKRQSLHQFSFFHTDLGHWVIQRMADPDVRAAVQVNWFASTFLPLLVLIPVPSVISLQTHCGRVQYFPVCLLLFSLCYPALLSSHFCSSLQLSTWLICPLSPHTLTHAHTVLCLGYITMKKLTSHHLIQQVLSLTRSSAISNSPSHSTLQQQ